MTDVRVLKFGGKSLSSIEKINQLAKKVSELNTKKIVIVVSAMGSTTSELLDLAKSANEKTATQSANRELDMLLASGERVSAALFTLALQKFGVSAQSFTGSQAGVLTEGPHSDASIQALKPVRILECLEKETVPVIAGFQGVDPVTKDVTTLGRGGSDLTACAFAHHFKTSAELYKTVGHVYTCDPLMFDFARPISNLSYSFMQGLSAWGGQILHDKAAVFAQKFQVPVHFHSDESFEVCTRISNAQLKSEKAISCLNSVLAVQIENKGIPEALGFLESHFKDTSFSVLASAFNDDNSRFLIHTPADKIRHFKESKEIDILDGSLSAVSLVFSEPQESTDLNKIISSLKDFPVKRLLETPKRLTLFVNSEKMVELVSKLHRMVC